MSANLKEAEGKALSRGTRSGYRRRSGARRPISSKPDTCTERYDVNPTGISVTVARLTPGDLSSRHVLPTSRGVGREWQKSAEVVVAALTEAAKGRTCVEWQVMHALRLATGHKLSGDRGAIARAGDAGGVTAGLRCLLVSGQHANGTSSRGARFGLVQHRNRRMRNHTSGGVRGRRG